MKIVLISCGKRKFNRPAQARELYTSPLFKKSLEYAERRMRPDKIFILSGKHHLLPLNKIIEPYNLTLNTMSTKEIRVWARRVINELGEEASLNDDEFILLAGEKYRRFLLPEIRNYKIPMEGRKIGEQLSFLKANT